MGTIVAIHDAYDLINTKMLINNKSIEIWENQIVISEKIRKIQQIVINKHKEKIKLVEELNKELRLQITKFVDYRQNYCLSLYESINEIDNDLSEYSDNIDEINKLELNMNKLADEIVQLNASMPDKKIVTQFCIINKNPVGTCAFEHNNI